MTSIDEKIKSAIEDSITLEHLENLIDEVIDDMGNDTDDSDLKDIIREYIEDNYSIDVITKNAIEDMIENFF